jgi:hypothetical protein
MLELCKELVALIEWEAEDFPCVTQPEIEPLLTAWRNFSRGCAKS